ncbi:MAG: hypothetical protein WDN28_05250 [Chthoniobacter sp.]
MKLALFSILPIFLAEGLFAVDVDVAKLPPSATRPVDFVKAGRIQAAPSPLAFRRIR